MRAKQLPLFTAKKYPKRKTARAISLRGANHIVLKSNKAILRRHHGVIRGLIRETQDRFGVKLRAFALMPDHVHLLVKVSQRRQFANALRFLSGLIALRVVGAKLWRARAWSRPVQNRRDLETVTGYIARNPIRARILTVADEFVLIGGVLQL